MVAGTVTRSFPPANQETGSKNRSQSWRTSLAASRVRAVCSRDLTIFAGTPSVSPISSYRQSREVPQHDDLAIFHWQGQNRGLDGAAAFGGLEIVGRSASGRDIRAERLMLRRVAAGVEALVDEDAVNPAEEPAAGIECLEALICLDESVLRCVARRVIVAEHSQRDREQRPLVAFDQAVEACLVALPASSHEDEVVRIVPDTHTGR